MQEEESQYPQISIPKKKILVINESPGGVRLLLELIKTTSIQLQMAFSGRDGLNKALLHQPDLILLDIALPDMEGFGVCRQLKAQASTRATPIIFVAGSNNLSDRLMGLSLGAVDYISKPFSEHEALARINIHLDLAGMLKHSNARALKVLPANTDTEFSGIKSLNTQAETATDFQEYERRRDVIVRLATQHLKKNLGAPPPPSELAQLIGTTERGLNEAFHAVFQRPIYGWLREERMRQACHLLTTTDTTIASIGEYLGFSTPANFSRSFRERFVMSPREMRAGHPPQSS